MRAHDLGPNLFIFNCRYVLDLTFSPTSTRARKGVYIRSWTHNPKEQPGKHVFNQQLLTISNNSTPEDPNTRHSVPLSNTRRHMKGRPDYVVASSSLIFAIASAGLSPLGHVREPARMVL